MNSNQPIIYFDEESKLRLLDSSVRDHTDFLGDLTDTFTDKTQEFTQTVMNIYNSLEIKAKNIEQEKLHVYSHI